MARANILVVEDNPHVVIFVVDQLEFLGHRVSVARDGREGLEKARKEMPDLVVLDVMMPEMDGYEVCQRLKSSPETERIPILMLTAKGQIQDKVLGFDRGADDYLPKPYDKAEFEARVQALLRRAAAPPFTATQDDCALCISLKPERRINVRVSGVFSCNAATRGVLDLDVDAYARQGDNAPRLDWRFNSKHWGKQLYRSVFVEHPTLLSNYNQALGEVGDEEKLRLCFESSRDLLRVPVEFLFEDVHADGDYLALKHPLYRSINGVHVKRRALSPALFNDLWARGEGLEVLLIASNTRPSIPGADREIEALDGSLQALFEEQGFPLRVKTIPSDEATYETVRRELQRRKYHVLHYAGHGAYDARSPEKSRLSFWEKTKRQGEVKHMPVSELRMLLRGSDLRFAYLSCCQSTQSGEPAHLLDDDFLGLADGLVHAGIPGVLGFRWPVLDEGARALALAFYGSLARQGQVDTALLEARCEVAARDRDDITWLSPILIMQV